MNRAGLFLVLSVFLALFDGLVSQTFTATSISGVFRPDSCQYVPGATQDTCIFETGISGDPTFSGATANQVTWGLEAGNGLSSLNWQPVVNAELIPGVVTLMGRMRHTNRPIDGDNDELIPIAVSWDLDITVTSTEGGPFLYEGEFLLSITETDNTPVDPIVGCPFEDDWSPDALPYPWTLDLPCCPFNTEQEVAQGQETINGPCSDKIQITITNNADQQSFTAGDTEYSLTLDGFRPTEDAQAQAIVDFFISQEKTSTDAFLFVSWTATCVGVADCDNGNPCTTGSCNAQGKCVQKNAPGSCTPVGSVNECQKGSCLNGECSVITNASKTGSLCGSMVDTVCRRTECRSGTCEDRRSEFNGDACGGSAPECQRNLCQDGNCLPIGTVGGSCTGISVVECQNRRCNAGSCRYENANNGDTCTTGSATECNRLGCYSGTCTELLGSTGSACGTAAAPECQEYQCRPRSDGGRQYGTCTIRDVGGSCTALPSLPCNRRRCNSGTCRYRRGNTGSCGTEPECKDYECQADGGSWTCVLVDGDQGGVCDLGNWTDCTERRCSSGSCVESNTNNGGTCTVGSGGTFTGVTDECNQPRCNGDGNCVVAALSEGTCTGTVAQSDCSRGVCNIGTCAVIQTNQGGTCTQGLGQAPLADPSGCARRICSSTDCIYSEVQNPDIGSVCGPDPDDCREFKCSETNTTNFGTCTTTFVPSTHSGSCTGDIDGPFNATADRCKIRKCDGAGQCQEVDRSQNALCRDDEGAFCRDERCIGSVCTNVSANTGAYCTEDGVDPPEDCFTNLCSGTTCQRSNNELGFDCRPTSNNRCLEYNCDGQGTCLITDSLSNKSCTGFSPLVSSLPEDCREALCDGEGTCAYAPANEGYTCGTVTNLCKPKYCQADGACDEVPLDVGAVCLNATVEETCNQRRCTEDLECEPDPAFNGNPCTPRDVDGIVAFCGEFSCDEGACRAEVKNVGKLCCPPGEEGETCEENFQSASNCTDAEGNTIPCDDADEKCREFRCGDDGTCKTVPLGTDVTCGNPGGVFCQEYTCDGRGHCNEATPKNITNAPCVGIDSTGIQTECQLFECDDDAICKSKIVEEGKECRNPQPTTNKRGIEDGIGPCEVARCNAFGRCELFIEEDGTDCNTPENEEDACWVGVCQDGECIESLTECENDFYAGSSTFEGGEQDECYYYFCDTVSGECVPDQNRSACSCAGCESCIQQRDEDGIPCLWCSYKDSTGDRSGTKCFEEGTIRELLAASSEWSFDCEGAEQDSDASGYTCGSEKSCQDADDLCGTEGNDLPFHWAYIIAAVAALASLGCIVCLLLAIAAALLLMIVKSATDTVAVIDTTGIAVNLVDNPAYEKAFSFKENPLRQ